MKKRFLIFRQRALIDLINCRLAALFLIAIYFVALFPLIRANYNYRDDNGRVLWGISDWHNFGRVTTDSLSHAVHADQYLMDISPLTQIIAVLIIVLASLLLLYIVRGNKKLTILDAVSVLPLGLFPYFLCCFSYKFDSPYMALSVLFSVFPFVFRNKEKIFFIASFICTLLMCTTYQASAGIFPMIVVLTAFLDWQQGKKCGKIVKYCLFSALAFIVAMLVFFLFVPKGENGYVAEKVSFNSLSFNHVIDNYLTYFKTFKSDYRIKWLAVIAIISALFFVRNTIAAKRNKFLTLVLAVAAFVIMVLLSLGAYPLLDKPFLMPRGMYGIGLFISLICIGATNPSATGSKVIGSAVKAVSCAGVVALGWLCIVFSCTYGNALAAQKSYDEFRIAEVASELSELPQLNNGKPTTIQVVGTAGYAAGINGIPSDGILKRLVPPPFGGENYWSYLKLLSYYGLPNLEYSSELSNEEYISWNTVHDNCYHTIYADGDRVVVELKHN